MATVQVDPAFQLHMLYLATHSKDAADGTLMYGQRTWFVPPLNGWSGNPLDLFGMPAAFDRSDLNAAYNKVLLDPAVKGTVGECAAAKLQIDHTASMERAFRVRHASRIRCAAHAAARKLGHGNISGVYLNSFLAYIQRFIIAAGDKPGGG